MSKRPEEVLQAWAESAPYWEKHIKTIQVLFEPVTRAMVEAAGIHAGQSVLDVAAGAGEPSLSIAGILGSSSSVTSVDPVFEMVAAAGRQAFRRGITNVWVCQCSAESLPFPDDLFDAVVCRFGAMFFSDPMAALGEMVRVAKPGGCLSFAAWHTAHTNPFFHVVTGVISRYVEAAPEDPDAPGAFRFAERGKLAKLLKDSGAMDVEERLLRFRIEAPISIEEFWEVRSEMSETLRGKLAALSPEQRLNVAAEAKAEVREFFTGNGMSFPTQVILVSGHKASEG